MSVNVCQKLTDMNQPVSYIAAILDLDLYADDSDDTVRERAASYAGVEHGLSAASVASHHHLRTSTPSHAAAAAADV